MKKILCIDDTPDEILNSGDSLKSAISTIFKNSGYKVIYELTGDDGIKRTSSDIDIRLVLLDVEFYEKVDGPRIADELFQKAPHTKVVVLSRLDDRGKKISFGHKPNVVNYVLKNDICIPSFQARLLNLSRAIIDDFSNKNWGIELIDLDTINLTNKSSGITYGIDIPGSMSEIIKLATSNPNIPILNPGGSTPGSEKQASLGKVLDTINSKIREETDWNTWGILSREKCAKGQLKLIIGSVENRMTNVNTDELSSLLYEFTKFKKNVEERLAVIEQKISPQKVGSSKK